MGWVGIGWGEGSGEGRRISSRVRASSSITKLNTEGSEVNSATCCMSASVQQSERSGLGLTAN